MGGPRAGGKISSGEATLTSREPRGDLQMTHYALAELNHVTSGTSRLIDKNFLTAPNSTSSPSPWICPRSSTTNVFLVRIKSTQAVVRRSSVHRTWLAAEKAEDFIDKYSARLDMSMICFLAEFESGFGKELSAFRRRGQPGRRYRRGAELWSQPSEFEVTAKQWEWGEGGRR